MFLTLTCSDLIEGTNIVYSNGKTFTVKANMTCTSKNVIYSIICVRCGVFYIGQTKNELRRRMTVHRQQTNTEALQELNVNKHIYSCSGGKFKRFPI